MKRYFPAMLAIGFVSTMASSHAAEARVKPPPPPPICKISPWLCGKSGTGPTFPIPPKKPGPIYGM